MTMLAILPIIILLAAPERDPTKRPRPPVFKFLGFAKDGALSFEVTNPNATPAFCFAYRSDPPPKAGTIQPLYEAQVRQDGWPWKGTGIGWCGVGAGWVRVAARTTVKFTVERPRGEWDEMRVWLHWCVTEDGKRERVTAWSEPVRRKKP